MSTQVAAHLRAAADVLLRDGWTQGAYVDDSGCRCLVGAILEAASDDYLFAATAFRSYLDTIDTGQLRTVVMWNDAPGRTADEVIAALRAAADRAEAIQ